MTKKKKSEQIVEATPNFVAKAVPYVIPSTDGSPATVILANSSQEAKEKFLKSKKS